VLHEPITELDELAKLGRKSGGARLLFLDLLDLLGRGLGSRLGNRTGHFKNYKRTCWEFYQFCSTGKQFQFFMPNLGDSAKIFVRVPLHTNKTLGYRYDTHFPISV